MAGIHHEREGGVGDTSLGIGVNVRAPLPGIVAHLEAVVPVWLIPLQRGKFVKLVIFDILGREVATLVNEQLAPGTYEMLLWIPAFAGMTKWC